MMHSWPKLSWSVLIKTISPTHLKLKKFKSKKIAFIKKGGIKRVAVGVNNTYHKFLSGSELFDNRM